MAVESRQIYCQYIVDLCNHPLNFYEMKKPDAKAEGSNPLCGDRITVFVKIKNKKIKEISFQGAGCAISKAAASIATEMAKGKTASAVKKISDAQIIRALGIPISPARMKCALLGMSAVRAALEKAR